MKYSRYLVIPVLTFCVVGFQNCSAPSSYIKIGKLATSLTSGSDLPSTTPTRDPASVWGTYEKPFAVDSPWNSRPIDPVFDTFEVPRSSYFPSIADGAYSTGMFLASETDGPMEIYGTDGVSGVNHPDLGGDTFVQTIPHWPASVIPASGSDGHADIVDPVANVIHSFWALKKVNGKWTAALYAWSKLDGRGFADPSHYYQGGRAVGIPASAGIPRRHEIHDGNAIYNHALAMSMTFNALSASPSYIFPATSSDWDAYWTNTGRIPEGALMMLPSTFDTSYIKNPDLKKIADTLKVYGAYVVDRNTGTPYVIYIENGSDFNLMPNGWDNTIAAQLDDIRGGLRQVLSAREWRDGDNKITVPNKNLNMLSMRGPWESTWGTPSPAPGVFRSLSPALEFSNTTTKLYQQNNNGTGFMGISWDSPIVGAHYRLTAHGTGGASLLFNVWVGGGVAFNSGFISDGQTWDVVWPAGGWSTVMASSGVGQASSIWGEFVLVP